MTYIQPVLPAAIILLLILGVRQWRSNKLLLATAVILGLWASPCTAWLTSGTLEWWYPPRRPSGDIEAIVVLGDAVRSPAHPAQPGPLPAIGTYIRCRYAAWLYHNWHAAPLVLTGGPGDSPADQRVANVMREVVLAEGVPASMIWIEDQSRSTFENAVFTKRLLERRGIRRVAVVTEAFHMLRAERAFRKQGLDVVPAPCAWRTLDIDTEPRFLLPTPKMLIENEDALHEWIGLAWYWASGKI